MARFHFHNKMGNSKTTKGVRFLTKKLRVAMRSVRLLQSSGGSAVAMITPERMSALKWMTASVRDALSELLLSLNILAELMHRSKQHCY
jgi:hypothetical protein